MLFFSLCLFFFALLAGVGVGANVESVLEDDAGFSDFPYVCVSLFFCFFCPAWRCFLVLNRSPIFCSFVRSFYVLIQVVILTPHTSSFFLPLVYFLSGPFFGWSTLN